MTSHGNLYFATDAFPGCEKAGVVSDTPLKTEVEWRYVIGPVVDRDFYNQERANMDIPRGPCEPYHSQVPDASFSDRQITMQGSHRKNI